MPGVRQTTTGVVDTSQGVASTVGVAVIDSWEDNDFAEWTNVGAGWSTQTAFTTDGTIGAQYSASTGDTMTRTTAEDGVMPAQGHIQKVDWRSNLSAASATNVEVRYRFADNGTDWYEVHHDLSNNTLEVWLRGSTNSRFINVGTAGYAANTHYETEIVWDDGTLGGQAGDFTVTVTDVDAGSVLVSGSGTNTAVTGPADVKFDLRIGEQVTLDFDYYRITNP